MMTLALAEQLRAPSSRLRACASFINDPLDFWTCDCLLRVYAQVEFHQPASYRQKMRSSTQ